MQRRKIVTGAPRLAASLHAALTGVGPIVSLIYFSQQVNNDVTEKTRQPPPPLRAATTLRPCSEAEWGLFIGLEARFDMQPRSDGNSQYSCLNLLNSTTSLGLEEVSITIVLVPLEFNIR